MEDLKSYSKKEIVIICLFILDTFHFLYLKSLKDFPSSFESLFLRLQLPRVIWAWESTGSWLHYHPSPSLLDHIGTWYFTIPWTLHTILSIGLANKRSRSPIVLLNCNLLHPNIREHWFYGILHNSELLVNL